MYNYKTNIAHIWVLDSQSKLYNREYVNAHAYDIIGIFVIMMYCFWLPEKLVDINDVYKYIKRKYSFHIFAIYVIYPFNDWKLNLEK